MCDSSVFREEVKAFLDGLWVNQDRPQRDNSFVPLAGDLADMKAFGGKPYPFMLVAIDALTKKVAAAAEGPSCNHHRGGHEEGVPSPGATPTTAPSSRGSSRNCCFWDIEKQVPRLLCRAHHPHHQGGDVALHSGRSGPAGAVAPYAA